MIERPIIFSGEMVRIILEGRKTQTRRIIKPQPKIVHAIYSDASIETERIFRHGDQRIYCPYGQVGNRLWVRETWTKDKEYPTLYYRATERTTEIGTMWEPSIFMPRWASRITLKITNVRVERLQDISKEDCLKEGLKPYKRNPTLTISHFSESDATELMLRKDFMFLWDSINGKKYPLESNCWVWVIEFRKVE